MIKEKTPIIIPYQTPSKALTATLATVILKKKSAMRRIKGFKFMFSASIWDTIMCRQLLHKNGDSDTDNSEDKRSLCKGDTKNPLKDFVPAACYFIPHILNIALGGQILAAGLIVLTDNPLHGLNLHLGLCF